MTPFKRVAVLNRGEAAVRFLRTFRVWSRESVPMGAEARPVAIAFYTDPDAHAPFVRLADERQALGPALVTRPDGRVVSAYCDHARVLAALQAARCDAVWPGWGFVAEDADFAEALEAAGITFIGPTSTTLRLLGDKIAARRQAEAADVPQAPWRTLPLEAPMEAWLAAADAVGYPLMAKASAGGGGRGIRRVDQPVELAPALAAVRGEAERSFGGGGILLEACLLGGRHVEVQLAANGRGQAWALGVRDCSIQRRHQKIIEESPSSVLPPALAEKIEAAAVRLAEQVHYRGVGTAEFLYVPATGVLSFLEVNARLQVEHPLTELLFGCDLVEAQLDLALGRPWSPPTVPRGHAIEARLNAEDPARGFTPRPGRLVRFRPPAGPGVRVDTGVEEGQTIAPQFDSMIAKVIAWGATRAQACARLDGALADLDLLVEDGATNRAFLRSVLAHPMFISGAADTAWLDRAAPALIHHSHPEVALIVAALLAAGRMERAEINRFFAEVRSGVPHRIAPPNGQVVELRLDGTHHTVRVLARSPQHYVVQVDAQPYAVAFAPTGPHAAQVGVGSGLDRTVHTVLFVEGEGGTSVEVDGEAHTVERAAGGVVASPMPAVVVAVVVAPGDAVAVGDVVCVLEAMKMETSLCAPVAGVVRQVAVQVHQQVGAGQTLVVLDREGSASAPAAASRAHEVGDAVEAAASIHALLSGYDVEAEEVEALRAALDAGTVEVPLAPLLAVFADTQALFDSQLPPTADPATSVSAELLFHDWCRRLSEGKTELDQGSAVGGSFAEVLARALAHFGPPGAFDVAIAWRLAVARAHGERRATLVAALLRQVVARHRRLLPVSVPVTILDRIASLTAGRQNSLADHVRLARFLLYEQAWFARQGRALRVMLAAVVDDLATAPMARRKGLMDCLVDSPHSISSTILRLAGQRTGGALRVERHGPLAEALVRRLYSGRTLGPFERVSASKAPMLRGTLRLAGDEVIATLAVVLGTLDRLDDALTAAQALVTIDEVVRPDCAVEILLAGQVDAAALDAEIAGCAQRHPALGQTTRITFTACAGPGPLRHRSFTTGWTALAVDIHPEAARRLELDRLAAFALTRLDAPEPLHAFHLRSREAAADERIFIFADLPASIGWPGGAGWTIERAFREALGLLHHAQSARDPRRRLYGNRIYLDIQPVTDLDTVQVARIAQSMEGATRGLGLEKVVVRARIRGADGEETPMIFNISRPGRHRLQVRAVPRSGAPIEPLTPYRLKVAAARRVGAVYPYEVVRMLCAEGQGPHPDLIGGTFVEYDLADDGLLGPVTRPWGQNRAGVVMGLITHRTPRYPEGFTRVFLASDPTHALGALAEPECRRVLAALNLAAQLDCPVEWLPISSGARIALDSGTENLDWTAQVLRRLVQHADAGGEVNLIVHGVNVGAQSYWNAEATMLMHTRGLLIMTADGSMVLTGKKALEYSGGVSAEDERGIGGFERIMGPNGQAQCFARDLGEAWKLLFEHYRFSGRAPGERHPRPFASRDPHDRSILATPYRPVAGEPFACLGDLFDAVHNPERKKPFDIRQLMAAVVDQDVGHFERWAAWRDAATAVVWDAALGGTPVCLVGIESRTLPRRSNPLDGPDTWSGGTLFPQSAKKIARALNAASGNRPAVVLANLSGFDGSPESMRHLQLEYGAELGRAVVRFRGPLVFLVVGRYHGGAYVVFSKALNPRLVALAVEGSFASVIGGAPAAAVVFGREVRARAEADPQLVAARQAVEAATPAERPALQETLEILRTRLLLEHQGALARTFDSIHTVERAVEVGSLDAVIPAARIRPALIAAIVQG